MKSMMLRATALGAVLLVAACGGGGGGSSPTNPDPGNPGGPGNPGNPGNPGGPGNPGNPGGPGNPGDPGGSSTVFTPAADDLPIDKKVGVDYPRQITPLVLDVEYQDTGLPVPTAEKPRSFIQYSDGSCSATIDPLSYPGNKTTLATLNRTKFLTKTEFNDECLPEIKVKVKSSDPDFKDDSGAKEITGKMRVRGSSTRGASQKSFRLKTDAKMWFGEDKLQLNKHPYDVTRVRNKLAFDLMKSIPHHQTMRTQFVEIKYTDALTGVEGSQGSGMTTAKNPGGSLGLFTHIEEFGKSYIKNRGWPEVGANIYKADSFSFNKGSGYGCDVSSNTVNAALAKDLSLEVGDGKKCDALMSMMTDVEDTGIVFQKTFDRYFNKNNYLTWLASVILFGNYDTTTQNFALYQHPSNGKFYFLPWDYDAALGYSNQKTSSGYAEWAYGVGNWWDSALHRRFMSEPGNIELLKAAVAEVRAKYLTNDAIKKLLDSYKPTVQGFVTKFPDGDIDELDATPEQWEAQYNGLVTSIEKNHQFFLESLKKPMPFWYSVMGAGGAAAEPGAAISELRWDWPDPWHPQGHKVTYEVQFLPFEAADKDVPAGKTAFDTRASQIVPKEMGAVTSLSFASGIPSGPHWIRVLAKDATNGTSTYAFDQSWDELGDKGRFGVICKVLPANTNCTKID